MKTGLASGLSAALLSAAFWGCSSTPTGPSAVPARTAVRFDLTGPADVAPGGTAQFRAVVQYSDGTSRDVTDVATWTSTDASVLTVTSAGRASGLAIGDGGLRVTFEGMIRSVDVIVVPAGTYRLKVRAIDAEVNGLLSSAVVTATAEDGTVLPKKGNGQDGYLYYGVRGPVEVHVLAGLFYEPVVQTVNVTGHVNVNIPLRLAAPPVDLSGTYTLVVTASRSCADRLPEAMRVRTYSASVEQRRAGSVLVRLAGGAFVTAGWTRDFFDGSIRDATHVEFSLDASWGSSQPDPTVVEALAESDRAYGLGGYVTATIADGRVTGTMTGEVQLLSMPHLDPVTVCKAADHGFTMTRQ